MHKMRREFAVAASSLPLEVWDMIISWIWPRKALYPVALVCWDFAELVKWHLRPRLRLVNKYNVIHNTYETDLFIDNGVPARYLIEKCKEEHNGYNIKLIRFFPDEYEIIVSNRILYARNMQILAASSEYLLLMYDDNFARLISIWDVHRVVNCCLKS